MELSLKDLACNHDYFASEINYYSKDATGYYANWNEFYQEFGDADIDMNLIVRWDIYQNDDEDISLGYYMKVIIIAQRKGIYMPIIIKEVKEENVKQIQEFLKPHFEKLLKIWQPLSVNGWYKKSF